MRSFAYWVIGEYEPGRYAVDGPHGSEKEANDMGFQLFPNQVFKVRKYQTTNKAKAISMWKHELAPKLGLSSALKPIRHKMPEVQQNICIGEE